MTRACVRTKWPSLETVERRHILRVVKEQRGNLSRAAGVLGIDRRTLYRKLEKYRPRHPAIQVFDLAGNE